MKKLILTTIIGSFLFFGGIPFIQTPFNIQQVQGATITKSIKASGGDYTSVASWESDLDNGAVYTAGDDAVGELYNESYLITAEIVLNGGGVLGLNSVKLSVASGQRSTGTAGTGARVTLNGSFSAINVFDLIPIAGTDKLILEYFEVNGNGNLTSIFFRATGATAGRVPVLKGLLVHDGTNSTASNFFVSAGTRDVRIINSIFYDYVMTANNRSFDALNIDCDLANGGIFNNIVDNVVAHGSGNARGYRLATDDVDCRVRNNIATRVTTNPLGFSWIASTTITSSNNLSDDTTADDGGGTGHVVSATFANMYVSTTAGSEDYSPKTSTAPQVDLGVDLVTTPTGVNIDYKGRDRDATGDTWDIGAIEFVSAGGGGGATIFQDIIWFDQD